MMKVEIWSDFVCPFCYIGKRQFEIGLEQFEHKEEVEVLFRHFQLDPYAKKYRNGYPSSSIFQAWYSI